MNSNLINRLGVEQRDEPYSAFRKAFGVVLVGTAIVMIALDGVLLASWYHALAFGSALLLGLLGVVMILFDLTVR